MNAAQVAAISRMTSRIDAANRLSATDSWLNGPVIYRIEAHEGGPLLFATNATDERRWWESDMFVGVLFGARGRATVLLCEGISKRRIA